MAQDTQWLISTNLVPARVRVGPTQCAETALPTSCSNDSHSVRREPSSPNPCLLLLLLRMRHVWFWIYHSFTHTLILLFLLLLSSSPQAGASALIFQASCLFLSVLVFLLAPAHNNALLVLFLALIVRDIEAS